MVTNMMCALLAVSVVSLADWTVRVLDAPEVTTKYGKVRGFYVENVAIYYGIPFASPPVVSLRWKAPQDAKPWGIDHVLNATVQKPSCPQVHCDILSPPLVCPPKKSEDCLYMDIFTPKDASVNKTASYPVMIFIHGGNFVRMSGTSPLFDGRKLAGTRGVIIVNFNYRMGALGFLVTGETREDDATGNYGILDQQLAMKWVQDNINDFGGDPTKVTLFGESAGAQSVLIHYTLPSSAPYFRNAIIESSPIAIPYKRFPEALILGSLLAELLGCPPRDTKCMRSKSAQEIANAQYQTRNKVSSLKLLELFEPWGPTVDSGEGGLIRDEPLEVIRRGEFNRKPLIVGTVSEETVQYIYSAWNRSVSGRTYVEAVFATYPGHFLQILPWNDTRDERDTMVKMSTDLVFACPTRNATRLIRSHGVGDVWMYVWDHAISFPAWGHVVECEGRVCHGSELIYLFHTEWAGNYTFTADEKVLSEQIMDFWTNFAKWGNPNTFGDSGFSTKNDATRKLKWPVYGQDGNWPNFRFKSPASEIEANYKGENCDFWDSIGYAA